MARIGKQEHPRILQMVDVEHRKVAEVAAEYGCTPANIYALLSKLRRDASRNVEAVGATTGAPGTANPSRVTERLSPPVAIPAAPTAGVDLFAPGSGAGSLPACEAEGGALPIPSAANPASIKDGAASQKKPAFLAAVPPQEPPAAPTPAPRSAVERLPASSTTRKAAGVGAALSKPGMALVMRTAEGEESMSPFRSLDDLLSAVKPILRAAVRSPDAVWFSIQPVDLASLDSDAA